MGRIGWRERVYVQGVKTGIGGHLVVNLEQRKLPGAYKSALTENS